MNHIQLPHEVLAHIFGYLTLSDMLESSLVCRSWFEATNTQSLHANTQMTFNGNDELDSGFPIYATGRRLAACTKLTLKSMTIALSPKYIQYFCKVCPCLTSLTLQSCQINEKDFVQLLSLCCKLRMLRLIDMNDVLISGRLLESEEDIDQLRGVLSNVYHLDLSRNHHLTDALFNRISSCMTNLSELVLDQTKIMNHSGIYKKFYPENQSIKASLSVFTFRNLLVFLKERSKFLKRLSFNSSSVDGVAIQDLAAVPGLSLEELCLEKCTMVSQEAILDLSKTQKNLKVLKLNHCRRVFMDYPATTLSIFQELSDIRDISLRGLTIPSPAFATCLVQMDKLERLDCSEMDVLSKDLSQGLEKSQSAKTLRFLKLISFESSPENLSLVIRSTTNLSELYLGNCQAGVTNDVVQAICEHLIHLRILSIRDCRRVTDVGLSGITTDDQERLSHYDFAKSSDKIFLGSKGETEILNEVKRLEELKRQAKSLDKSHSGHKIQNLRRLADLELNATKVSDITIKHAFSFFELRHLNLSLCTDVTDVGLAILAVNNPTIETLKLKQCNIGDVGLLELMKHSPRLQHLDIEACSNVTCESFLQLEKYCPLLRFIDVSFCNKIRIKDIETLQSRLPSLRNVVSRGLHIAEALQDFEDE